MQLVETRQHASVALKTYLFDISSEHGTFLASRWRLSHQDERGFHNQINYNKLIFIFLMVSKIASDANFKKKKHTLKGH